MSGQSVGLHIRASTPAFFSKLGRANERARSGCQASRCWGSQEETDKIYDHILEPHCFLRSANYLGPIQCPCRAVSSHFGPSAEVIYHLVPPWRCIASRGLTLANPGQTDLSTSFKRTCPQGANRFISRNRENSKGLKLRRTIADDAWVSPLGVTPPMLPTQPVVALVGDCRPRRQFFDADGRSRPALSPGPSVDVPDRNGQILALMDRAPVSLGSCKICGLRCWTHRDTPSSARRLHTGGFFFCSISWPRC